MLSQLDRNQFRAKFIYWRISQNNMAEVKEESKNRKAGRPKGAKSKINLPIRNIDESIEWTKKAYEGAGDAIMSSEELGQFIGVNKGFTSPAISVLDKFGLIEKIGSGWKISDLGKRAINNDKSAIKESLERVDLFRELIGEFLGKKVTPGTILSYLKGKYKKGENNESIVDKYLKSIQYLSSIQGDISNTNKYDSTKELGFSDDKLILLLNLKYAYYPPDSSSRQEITENFCDKFKDNNPFVVSLINQIRENQNNDQVVKALVNALINSFTERYPALSTERKSKDAKKKESLTK